jgi:hypothetical protein
VTDFDEVKKRASLPTRTVSLCLAGELVEEIARLEQQLADAQPATSLGDVSPKRAIAEQIAAVQDEMRESTVDFHLRAMGARAWARFWASMPTRAEKESDEAWEERAYPFYADLVSRSCTDPVMSVAQIDELVELIHGAAWNRLANQCITLNMGGIDIPNSAAVSELIGISEQA